MHRITDCRATRDYNLWVRFEDGTEGTVFLGNLVEVSAFSDWRRAEAFCGVVIDCKSGTVAWPGGITLDPDILYQDVRFATAAGKISAREASLALERAVPARAGVEQSFL